MPFLRAGCPSAALASLPQIAVGDWAATAIDGSLGRPAEAVGEVDGGEGGVLVGLMLGFELVCGFGDGIDVRLGGTLVRSVSPTR